MAGLSGRGTKWRLHAVVPRSAANGPGTRCVIWSQGCGLGCPGCFNPETHTTRGEGLVRTVGEVADQVLADAARLEGVTLTGGEPLEQPAAVAAFCAEVKARSGLGVIVLTGFHRAEIEGDPARSAAVADADLVIAGRYNARLHLAQGLRGSSNKEYWVRTGRYTAADLSRVPELEITIADDATVTFTGMHAPGGEF
ncbi:4Fe-4S single cluster domain-containing protein [Streptomyces rishiriensis]|uniref:Anaerobic ribonucleoside-triphosphate reductase activating protein n=1 Tax=Streptomyces rishiriensis TaxID=68264 RepID=A0ABU0NGV5_STRRH|nr:4Fe-4S single cluster domain-containing protein [Streptomyces rishiriensis]MDQ0578334.1 anaerobic ribonucleoside-triphosphate reductase activating protein [Streptomyces rishiriensis]